MKSVTASQCRAARALLNWGQPELAARCGMHVQTICHFEQNIGSPTQKTLFKITKALESAGIEFFENGDGLRIRDISTTRYHGDEEFRNFFDDVYETAKTVGGPICLFNGVPGKLQKHLGKDWYGMHAQRMTKIKNLFDFKVIIREGERLLIGKTFVEYRWFPKKLFNERTIYVYGDKVAFINFDQDNVKVLVVSQSEVADSFRILFNIAWGTIATPIKDIE